MEGEEIALKTWEIYFPSEEYTMFNKQIGLIIEIRKGLDASIPQLREIAEKRVFECDFNFFQRFDCSASLLKCFSCAVSERIYEALNEMVYVETKIVNHNKISQFSEVDTSSVDTLVSLIGTCCRVGFKKIENLEAYFQCSGCSAILKTAVKNNIYKNPKCPCKGKAFIFLSSHPDLKCIDKQNIKIQEVFASESNMKVLEVDLYGNCVGSVAPGDLVQITGIIRAELCGDAYKLKIECNNISVIKNRNQITNEDYFQTDYQIFRKISEEPNIISVFINALFPNIYGNTLIKAGLVLSLFGGTKKFAGPNPIRSEIHTLIIGDPGLGKSKLLLNACSVLPKSIYISGNFCTSSGLTVSISHDPATGEYMADAGALVVSDGGICCIDEFDKIDDHTALFEAMEDQKVTVAKGGVCCSVPSRSTIIAASNPRYGHFNSNKTIRENIKFDTGLISRFDLVYILIDNLNEQENYEISNQILKRRHHGNEDTLSSVIQRIRSDTFIKPSEAVYSKDIIKKYIEYARLSVNPVLSKAAKQRIKEYYVDIRKNKDVSIRNLESLIRLTESCAKLELKSIASVAHATFAINLYKKIFIKEEYKEKEGKTSLEDLLKEFVENNRKKTISKRELSDLIRNSKTKKSENEIIEIMNYKGVLIKGGIEDFRINI